MDLFEAFNAPATAAVRARPVYRANATLEAMRLHKVEEVALTTTAKGDAQKVIMYSPAGEYIFTYTDRNLTEAQCASVRQLVEGGQPPFYFTALGKGRRINGLVPFGAAAAAAYKSDGVVVGDILPPTLKAALVAADLLTA